MKSLFDSNELSKKPIFLISTDGAQDEAPRFPKSLKVAVFLFKYLGLDVYIHATNAAAEILSEVWSKTVINGFKVDSKAVGQECHYEPDELDQLWVSQHVIQTRYMVMVVKCQIESCCKPFVTNWMDIFPTRFLPGNNRQWSI